MTDKDLRAKAMAATPGPWLRGWWSGQAERMCDCSKKGRLLGKREQNQYPGAGPFHVHETDFFPDEHQLSGEAPECATIAGNYDYESGGIIEVADAEYMAAASPDVLLELLDRLASAEGNKARETKLRREANARVRILRDALEIVDYELSEITYQGAGNDEWPEAIGTLSVVRSALSRTGKRGMPK